jgi:glycosyltransferase involved in cell wall biosynthesis
MMNKDISEYKVALVTESLWKMAGANRVLESFAEVFPQADIYALFGEQESLSKSLRRHSIYFSFLNRLPFIKKMYRYTFSLWPIAVENFDLSEYDLVISNTSSVTHGVITPLNCKHVAYVNSSMRYAWDLKPLYFDVVKFGFLKRVLVNISLLFNRTWDVVAAQRPIILLCNSSFVAKRIKKYWDREVDKVISPPVDMYKGKINLKRENYYIAGAPFEPNKRGDFLLECASKIGFNLKILGTGSMKKKLKRKYRKYENIEILDWVSEEEKWKLISNARGMIVAGIEDFGIFSIEALSAGTPIIAYKGGGSLEIVNENISGLFFNRWDLVEFKRVFNSFERKQWHYIDIQRESKAFNTKDMFKEKLRKLLVE